jgi:hypothetical protein
MYRNNITFILVFASIMVGLSQDTTKVDLPIKPKIDGYHARGSTNHILRTTTEKQFYFDRTSVIFSRAFHLVLP